DALALELLLVERLHRLDVDHPLAVGDADDDDALRVAAGLAHRVDVGADDLAAAGHDHDLVARVHQAELDHRAVPLARDHGDDALAAAVLQAPLGDRRALAVAVRADRQHLLVLALDDVHADDLIAVAQIDAADAAGVAAHRPHVADRKADRHAGRGAEQDL